jgi:hypothetical protein
LQLRSNIFVKSYGIAIAEVLPSSYGIAIADSKEVVRALVWWQEVSQGIDASQGRNGYQKCI